MISFCWHDLNIILLDSIQNIKDIITALCQILDLLLSPVCISILQGIKYLPHGFDLCHVTNVPFASFDKWFVFCTTVLFVYGNTEKCISCDIMFLHYDKCGLLKLVSLKTITGILDLTIETVRSNVNFWSNFQWLKL